ncbi:MAG: hypothetical protein JNM37_09245 [Rhodocyclaceae bacterium]|nr:hypothetical protein [Rhodocyclaceae bacterium]
MDIEELEQMACQHWREWLPEKTAELVAEGIFEQEVRAAAAMAHAEIAAMLRLGYREDEAAEEPLQTYILLTPEPNAGLSDELLQEIEEREAEYAEMMRGQAKIDAKYDAMD